MKLSISKRSTEIRADDHALQQRRFGAALLHGDAEDVSAPETYEKFLAAVRRLPDAGDCNVGWQAKTWLSRRARARAAIAIATLSIFSGA